MATAVRLPAAALSWFPRREPGALRTAACPSGSCFSSWFFINPGNFNPAKPRVAGGRPLAQRTNCCVIQLPGRVLQAAFQSELICKQMQGLLLRPADCSESLESSVRYRQGTVSLCRDPVQSVGKMVSWPRSLPARITTRFFLPVVLLFCNDLRQCHEPAIVCRHQSG